MSTTASYTTPEVNSCDTPGSIKWYWVALLMMLSYEAAGLSGGSLLVAAPDSNFLDMPAGLMQGMFADFMIPCIILFALGVLSLAAFVMVLHRKASDWLIASLALGGLTIWFVVEIIILQELHWLHLVWGYPVRAQNK